QTVEETQFIGVRGNLWKQLRNPAATLSVLLELEGRAEIQAILVVLRLFAVVGLQLRFVIKRVHVGRRAFHAQEDDPFGSRREMRLLGQQQITVAAAGGRSVRRGACRVRNFIQ